MEARSRHIIALINAGKCSVSIGDFAHGDFLIAHTASNIDLIFFANPEAKPGQSPIIVFTLADGGIDNIVSGLAKKGVTIVTPLSEAPGGWSADLADPDGHVFSVYQSEEIPR